MSSLFSHRLRLPVELACGLVTQHHMRQTDAMDCLLETRCTICGYTWRSRPR